MRRHSLRGEVIVLAISLPALVGFCNNLGKIVARHRESLDLLPWTEPFFNRHKIHDYVAYISFILAAMIILNSYPRILRMKKEWQIEIGDQSVFRFLTIAFASMVCFFFRNLIDKSAISIVGQVICLAYIFFSVPILGFASSRLAGVKVWMERNPIKTNSVAVTLATLLLLRIYAPFLQNTFIYPNEYLNIATTVKVGDKTVDSLVQLNKSLAPHVYIKDSRQSSTATPPLNPKLEADQRYDASGINSQKANVDALLLERDLEKKFRETGASEFLNSAALAVEFAVQNRYVFHHHIHLLNPVFRYMDGQSLNSIYSHWGKLATLTIAWLQGSVEKFTFASYIRDLYYIKLIYLVSAMLIAWCVLQKQYLFFGFSLLVVASQAGVRLRDLVLTGPGTFKDIFDLLALFLFFKFLRQSKKKWLVASSVVAVVSFYNYPLFGLFLGMALVSSLALRFFHRAIRSHASEVGIFLSIWLAGAFLCKTFVGGLSGASQSYSIEGFVGWPLGVFELFGLLTVYFCSLLAISYLAEARIHLKYFAIALWIYSSQMTLYYVWQPTSTQFLVICIPLFLLLAVTTRIVLDSCSNLRIRKTVAFFCLAIPGLLVVKTFVSFHEEVRDKTQHFQSTSVVRQSVFPSLGILTTMDETVFVEAAEAIRRHSPADAKIFIVSKYENILPMMARKYSALPFPDLQWFLLSQNELDEMEKFFEESKPGIFFADTDLVQAPGQEVFPVGMPVLGYWHDESLSRSQRLGLLRRVLDGIRSKYEVAEAGKLVTVYRRIKN